MSLKWFRWVLTMLLNRGMKDRIMYQHLLWEDIGRRPSPSTKAINKQIIRGKYDEILGWKFGLPFRGKAEGGNTLIRIQFEVFYSLQ